jgi:DNA polymerase I-like protein with 3'-5' exonuclease and polymerase domains
MKPTNTKITPNILGAHFFDSAVGLGLKPLTKKTDKPSTAHEHLTMFYDTPDAKTFVELMQAANSARKMRSTYVDGFLEDLRPDSRLHPTGMLFKGGMYDASDDDDSGTVTGRTAFKGPAVQTIPKMTYWAKKLRKAYIAPPGKLVWARDFKQGELKVIACVAGEEKMIAVYQPGSYMNKATGGDLHALTGAKFAGHADDVAKFLAMKYVKEQEADFAKYRQYGKHEAFFLRISSWQIQKLQACGV